MRVAVLALVENAAPIVGRPHCAPMIGIRIVLGMQSDRFLSSLKIGKANPPIRGPRDVVP